MYVDYSNEHLTVNHFSSCTFNRVPVQLKLCLGKEGMKCSSCHTFAPIDSISGDPTPSVSTPGS